MLLNMGTLFVVATPIGNLEDFTFRALRVLKEVDVILCEDTRVTKKLLAHYKIEKPLLSYHQHSKTDKMQEIFDLLCRGKNLALVCDAGTPGISDPGNELVSYLLRYFERSRTIRIVPIPGPSALTTIASVAGIPMDKFVFLGYPPHKKGRKKFFEEVAQSVHPVVFYESPFRVQKSLREVYSLNPDFYVVVGRELTKHFETVCRGTFHDLLVQFTREKPRGEFVIVVYREK
jgi:16S rRNA (cytidine1402-2'-O)-methyltransferase